MNRTVIGRRSPDRTTNSRIKRKPMAARRLRRDLLELQRDGICSVAALPLEKNLFEWHVNIKPVDGVYSGVYFHLIMVFPTDYPASPPVVKIKTPISHPNIFGEWLCLSMIKKHTATVPYEGWSGAYSVSSILMQLQSFLFAEKIDQDYGGQANAQLTDQDVNRSLECCQTLKCPCGHSHDTPWPPVKGPPQSMIKIFPSDPQSGHVQVIGSAAQTTHTSWVGAYGEFGVCRGRVQYEAFINWTGDKWARDNIRGGLCRFGFGTEYARVCGRDGESFGYGGTGMFSFYNNFTKFGEPFTTKDTITVAIDFEARAIYFAKNGQILNGDDPLTLPHQLCRVPLYPLLSFKNSRAEFNFGTPLTPCSWLQARGFRTLEEVVLDQRGRFDDEGNDDGTDRAWHGKGTVDWHHEAIIPELWLSVFCGLTVQDLFAAKFVCRSWHRTISRFNVSERMETSCFFTKKGVFARDQVLGIGVAVSSNSRGFGPKEVRTQMDMLSESAWTHGVRTGVWGEQLTHFLPMVLNREHSDRSGQKIEKYLLEIARSLCAPQQSQRGGGGQRPSTSAGPRSTGLRMLECLATMMNQIVVQLVMQSEAKSNAPEPVGYEQRMNKGRALSMRFCEKAVVGYCALHHLLLWLKARYRREVTQFADHTVARFLQKGTTKTVCPDLGKFLIYLMISSRTKWHEVAPNFILEVMTRNVRWMVQEPKYRKYDTIKPISGRRAATFSATKTSRRLVMFQVWFMRNCSTETLRSYNDRLGRPRTSFRNAVLQKTRSILDCKRWSQYFEELGVAMDSKQDVDQLLRFAVGNSIKNGYHGRGRRESNCNPPQIRMIGASKKTLKQSSQSRNAGNTQSPSLSTVNAEDESSRLNYLKNRPSAFDRKKVTNGGGEGQEPGSNGKSQTENTSKSKTSMKSGNGSSSTSKSGSVQKQEIGDENGTKKLSKAQRRRLRKKKSQSQKRNQ